VKLTIKSAAGVELPAGRKDHVWFDDDISGFGIRIREGGSRTWIYRYRHGSKQRSITLGAVSAVPLGIARANAGKLEAEVRLGGDPALQKQTARQEAEHTFGGLAAQYLQAKQSKWAKNTIKENTRRLMTYAKPLHKLPITAITQRHIANLLNTITRDNGEISANRARTSLSAMFGWVLGEGIRLPEGNVVSYTNQHEESSRDRVLSDAELKAIWGACRDNAFGAVIKLLMLTGQRKTEIGSLRWDEVYDEQIVLPAERTKNKRAHTIPLSDAAGAVLKQISNEGRRCVFGRADSGFGGWNWSKQQLDAQIAKTGAPLAPWTLHDLRRTVATRMADLGVQPHIIEAVLNHVSGHKGGVAGIYNRATYDKEKREALALWGEHVMALIEGRKSVVVPMKRA
jgi:integrase